MYQRVLFGTNGIRGIVNQDLTPEFAAKVGAAIGTYFGKSNILIGYDARTSNILLSRAIAAGAMSCGCNIHDTGCAPTPAIQYAVKHFGMDGAIIVTASHNPPEYNGIKVVAKDGVEIVKGEEEKIEDAFFDDKFSRTPWSDVGKLEVFPGIIEAYKKAVKSQVDVKAIQKRHFKVVVDPANSVGALVTPDLLRELGCKTTTINANLDGHFPGRTSEPRPDTLTQLSAAVKAFGADLGVAHDGDADRCIFADETGEVILGDKTGAIIIDWVLEKHPKAVVVTPVSSSKMVEDIVKKHDSEVVWTEVGSTVVSRRMLEVDSVISMEDNGGIFYGPHQPVRDGAMSVALMLNIMADRAKPLSKLIGELPKYSIIKERVEVPNEKKKQVLEKILEETKGLERLTMDGVKVTFGQATVLIRPSGTEAIYRVVVEANDDKLARELADWGVKLVKNSL
ncbi:phosphoglucosamine mutase [Candidatus Bathyarchaeota archaeon]|nr:phosphoglucosamine mutase [Candidatus Bathyarchaeota archaeon]